jgi:hypothetical protein
MIFFIFASTTLTLRGIMDTIVFSIEFGYQEIIEEKTDVKAFNVWFENTYPKTFIFASTIYLILVATRNIGFMINLTRWNLVENGI